MGTTIAIFRKELRSYFNSPIAYVFLILFVNAALAMFFRSLWASNQASLRGLFDALPLMLLLVVPALTMRLWSEERKLGTFEILMTLPVRSRDAVLGKFFASWALLAVALVLTLGAPITIALYGEPDLGPIVGGYAAAVRKLGFTPASTMNDALEIASDTVGRAPTVIHLHVPGVLVADVK